MAEQYHESDNLPTKVTVRGKTLGFLGVVSILPLTIGCSDRTEPEPGPRPSVQTTTILQAPKNDVVAVCVGPNKALVNVGSEPAYTDYGELSPFTVLLLPEIDPNKNSVSVFEDPKETVFAEVVDLDSIKCEG